LSKAVRCLVFLGTVPVRRLVFNKTSTPCWEVRSWNRRVHPV
jgi:hypothetical protein